MVDTTKKSSSPYLPWMVVFSASLFFFYEFIQMQMFNTISPFLLNDFKISATTLGYMSSAYLLADIFFIFPAGMLVDRYSIRTIILLAMWISVLSTILFSVSHHIILASIFHACAGIGNAFCFLCCIRLASKWFPARLMALVVGLVVTMAFAGGAFAQTPLAWLLTKTDWRHALGIIAVLGLMIIGIVWLFVQDHPVHEKAIFDSQKKALEKTGIKRSVNMAFSNWQNWSCGLYTSFVNVPLMLLGGLWGGLYLTAAHQLSAMQASYVTSMIFFGSMVGCPIIGALSDRLALRKLPMVIFACIALPILLMIIYMDHLSLNQLLALFFALGFFTSAQIIAYPTITESSPKMITGTSIALASVLIMVSPMLFEPLFGYLMDKIGGAKIINGVYVYTAQAYRYPMLFLSAVLLMGLIVSLFIRETHAKNVHDA